MSGLSVVPVKASTTRKGIVELATTAEAQAGFDAERAMTPEGTKAAQGLVLLGTVTANNSAAVSFAHGVNGVVMDGTYKEYVIEAIGVVPGTDSTHLYMTASQDAGSNWLGASSYSWRNWNYATVGSNNSDSKVAVTNPNSSMGNAAGESGVFQISLFNLDHGVLQKHITLQGTYSDPSGVATGLIGSGSIISGNAINGVRFAMSSGNIGAGLFNLYGIRKA